MSVPVPVDIDIAAPPVGWTAQAPNQFQDLATLVASLMSGTITASFLTGQVGGSAPSSDIGPWANGNTWWFWDSTVHQYQPSEQGAPVGTIMMWGHRIHGGTNPIPSGWLNCNGQLVPTATYPKLFSRIGYSWGGSGASFALPPPGVMFLNASGFTPDGNDSAYNASHSPDGAINRTGGAQTAMIKAGELPACQIRIPFVNTQMITGTTNQPNINTPGSGKYAYPVTDENGNILGAQQQPISTMPPFAVVHYIIKYL